MSNMQERTETQERRPGGGGLAFQYGAVRNAPDSGQLVTVETATPELPAGFTPMQEAFCQEFVRNGANGPHAAETAGYASGAHQVAHAMLKNPKIRARIQEIVQQKLETKGLVVGYGVLIEIAQDPDAPPGVRRHCARDLLELAGFYKDRVAKDSNHRKPLSEMSRDELEDTVAKSAAVLRAAAKVERTVDAHSTPDNAQVSDASELSRSSE